MQFCATGIPLGQLCATGIRLGQFCSFVPKASLLDSFAVRLLQGEGEIN
jgi:hypothetical protein